VGIAGHCRPVGRRQRLAVACLAATDSSLNRLLVIGKAHAWHYTREVMDGETRV
jgi:hypothetical protein